MAFSGWSTRRDHRDSGHQPRIRGLVCAQVVGACRFISVPIVRPSEVTTLTGDLSKPCMPTHESSISRCRISAPCVTSNSVTCGRSRCSLAPTAAASQPCSMSSLSWPTASSRGCAGPGTSGGERGNSRRGAAMDRCRWRSSTRRRGIRSSPITWRSTNVAVLRSWLRNGCNGGAANAEDRFAFSITVRVRAVR